MRFKCLICLVGLTLGTIDIAFGQAVLYDNLDNVRAAGHVHTALGSDRHYAQQFLLKDSTNVDQVSILLQRPQAGVTGSLRIELWRDNGSGKPVPVDDSTGKVAELGTILDVTQVPVGEFGQFTFDNLVLGLEPNTPYWIVTDFEEVKGISGGQQSLGWAEVFDDPIFEPTPPGYDATAGANGAGYTPDCPMRWKGASRSLLPKPWAESCGELLSQSVAITTTIESGF